MSFSDFTKNFLKETFDLKTKEKDHGEYLCNNSLVYQFYIIAVVVCFFKFHKWENNTDIYRFNIVRKKIIFITSANSFHKEEIPMNAWAQKLLALSQ